MKNKVNGNIQVNNKKYPFFIQELNKEEVYFKCDGAGADQEFHINDIGGLILALPDFIIEEQEYRAKNKQVLRFRVSKQEKKNIMKNALKKGYDNVSAFLRDLALGKGR
jgi:hypothetical protein